LKELITYSIAQLSSPLENINLHDDIYSYLMDRLRGIYLDEGIPIESFNAVNATNPCTIIDFDHRIQSIIKFMASDHSIALASSNKRIKNILKDHSINSNAQVNNQLFNTAEEHILYNQLQESETELEKYIKTNDYGAFLEKLSQLRDPIDNFFDKVMVMDKDSRIRDNRIQLLSSIYNKFLTVADISYLHV
jgi:glycyl-tRNA synthetase beta chain